jgi:hypothetical protein
MRKKIKHTGPKAGTIFEKRFRGRFYKLTVTTSFGKHAFDLGGRTFKTPTAAAKSITKYEVNGWKFWGIDAPKPSARKGRPRSVVVTNA